jgi:hypothetical protein
MIRNSIAPLLPMKIKVFDIGWSFVFGITFTFAEDTDSDLAEDAVDFHTLWGLIEQSDVCEYAVLINGQWFFKDELQDLI